MAQALGLSAYFGDMVFAQSGGSIRIRRSATSQAAATDIATLRSGVSALKANSASTQYRSWLYWANSHGTPNPIPPALQGVWNKCHHGTRHFFSWHRAYVFFFESLIREITQTDAFALPYWDWYRSASIPTAFARRSVGGRSNELFHRQRAYVRRTLLRGALQQGSFDAFQPSLEGNPHGTVHVMVGGEMGRVPTSARDPLFWAHHANVDRMWGVWLALDSQRRNPSDSGWLNQSFAFDVEGNNRLTVAELVDTEALGYGYDSMAIVGPPDAVPSRPQNVVVIPATTRAAPSGAGRFTLSEKKRLSLTGSSLSLDMRTPPAASSRLSTMAVAPSARSGQLTLVLEGVRATALGRRRGFEYRIYANLPPVPGTEHRHADFFLGVFNSFQLSYQTGDPLSFPVSQLAPALAKQGLWTTAGINVSLISEDKETSKPLVTIENVMLIMSNAPTD
ncbi:MAG: tyrosinase family protein [Methylococcaceae bacterium]|nr:tyrosinase family protein [Methylococcaceae bacterium]